MLTITKRQYCFIDKCPSEELFLSDGRFALCFDATSNLVEKYNLTNRDCHKHFETEGLALASDTIIIIIESDSSDGIKKVMPGAKIEWGMNPSEKKEFYLNRLYHLLLKIQNAIDITSIKEDQIKPWYFSDTPDIDVLLKFASENSFVVDIQNDCKTVWQKLSMVKYFRNLFFYTQRHGIDSEYSGLFFANQILTYYTNNIKHQKFEDIYSYSKVIKNLQCNTIQDISYGAFRVSNGIPTFSSDYFSMVNYLGSSVFILNSDVNDIVASQIKEHIYQMTTLAERYNSHIVYNIEEAISIGNESLQFIYCVNQLSQNKQIKSNIELRDKEYELYKNGDTPSVLKFLKGALEDSSYPFSFQKEICIDYDREGTLIIDYKLPKKCDLPSNYYKELKHSSEWVRLPDSKLNACYDDIICALALRTIGEVLTFDSQYFISKVGFNGYIEERNPATGILETKYILSLLVDRNTFMSLDLNYVKPKECVKFLKGVCASKISSYTAIKPIINQHRDSRVINSKDIDYTPSANLAEMDWEDFEHLVRQIFEWEFQEVGGEVNVTQASRDGGVDAIIFDPDPIRGGKIIVQAKRYTNTVGVSAVRDLYGTIINEGANKGILITTSDYGPDAYKFATGKPITLLNGGHLLYLLEKHGRKARIDLKEAKENMGRQGTLN